MQSHRLIRKAVIPAAGLGTRMLPYTKVAPKEMMPLVDTPVIQHVVSEAVASGIETIIFVINESRAAVRNYFSPAPDLVDRLVLRGRVDEADSIRRLSRLADMRFVRQPEALGVGHAIACATEEIGDEPFAVLLPDNIVDFEVPCIKQLMECYQSFPGCVVAGRAIDPRLTSSFGMLLTEPVAGIKDSDRVLKVIELIEKPAPGTTPAIYGIHGRYVLEPSVLSCLDRQIPTNRGEVQITDALSMHIREGGAVHMLKFDGETYDTGDKLGYIKANIAFGLKHPEIGFQLREHLRTLSS